jgi:uncharacterized protein YbaP (TraB family)
MPMLNTCKTLIACSLAWAGLLHAASCPPTAAAPDAEQLRQAQAQARDHGLLWRFSKDGRRGWLYGSIHIGRLASALPGPKLSAALRESDTLALELDPSDPAIQQALAAGMARPLSLDDATRQLLARRIAAACLPEAALASMHPVMQAVTLSLLEARWEGLEAGYGSEMVLVGIGQARQMRVVSLETPQEQLAALLPEDAQEARRLAADTLAQLEQGQARPVMRQLHQAWERGDLATLTRYEHWCDCVEKPEDRAFLQRLIGGRNPALAERIAARHQAGAQLFVAVGALHMTGPQGLPTLLASRGFVVERVDLQRAP